MSGFDPFGAVPDGADADEINERLVPDTSALKAKIPDVPDVEDVDARTVLQPYRKNRPAPPLEEYVSAQVGEVKVLVALGRVTNPIHLGEDRVARAERYARWRWQGYIDGEIKSL
jgi:hypothetical protein